ncbi:SGNH/GDSL hydrolase family protein [Jatrophihabitans sp. YIM 134969]
MLRRLLVVLPAVALGAGVALAVPAGAAAEPPAGTAGKTYVAMGDSYAAGYGLPPSEGTRTEKPVPGCNQTDGDYPHLLAGSLGLGLTDVSCSGATTADFTNPQQVTPGPPPPPQLDVFTDVQPDLVTITIGGNDLGFSGIGSGCLAASANGPIFFHPTFNSCKAYFESLPANSRINPYNRIAPTLKKVAGAIKAVKAAAPNSKIVVIAYPAIAPDAANTPAGGCYAANALPAPFPLPGLPISLGSTFPFTDTDVPFLQVLQQRLDDGIGEVAAANGAQYADIYPASLAHSACQPETERWVEPIIPAAAAQGATNTLHPNLAGTTAMANALDPVVQALFPTAPTSTPPSSGVPTTPAPTSTAPATATGGASTVAAGGEPLANTGTKVPVSWLLAIAAVAVGAGAVSVGLGRPRRARH